VPRYCGTAIHYLAARRHSRLKINRPHQLAITAALSVDIRQTHDPCMVSNGAVHHVVSLALFSDCSDFYGITCCQRRIDSSLSLCIGDNGPIRCFAHAVLHEPLLSVVQTPDELTRLMYHRHVYVADNRCGIEASKEL
jgi:hypothetical protein